MSHWDRITEGLLGRRYPRVRDGVLAILGRLVAVLVALVALWGVLFALFAMVEW